MTTRDNQYDDANDNVPADKMAATNAPRHGLLSALLLCPLIGAVAFAPVLVGSFSVMPAAVVLALAFALALYAFGGFGAPARPKKIAAAALSVCFAVACFDLMARPLVARMIGERPRALTPHTWEPLPLVFRYDASVSYDGKVFGDLAAMSLDKSLRQYRDYVFRTDAAGFRNDPVGAGSQPPDLILLGDSFGVGAGTTQEETWGALLARGRGWRVYNLSMEGAGPWQELINLELEIDRIKPRAGALVLWAIFAGNDLDDPYYTQLTPAGLPRQGRLRQLVFDFKKFRYRSPVRRVVAPAAGAWDSRANVIVRELPGGRKVLFYAPYDASRRRTREDVMRHQNFAALEKTVGAMRRFVEEKGLRLAILCLPSKEEVYSWALDGAPPWSSTPEPSGFAAALDELSRRQGVTFVDLKPRLIAESRRAFEGSGALLWWSDDTHWNETGHRVAAGIVSDELLRAPPAR
jgi:glycosyltransferase involved in cell wall biosynthesis